MNTPSPTQTIWQRSTVVRFLRWFFRWRTQRVIWFVLFCLVTLVCLFYAEENWRGKRAWENYRREWEAKGEKFDLVSLAPAPVPDARNFALVPLLKPLFDYTRSSNHLHWLDTNGFAYVHHIRADLVPSDDRTKPAGLGNVEKGTFTDLEAWRDFYRGNTNYPQPAAPGSAAADVLVALGKFDADLQQLREAAAARPDSRFPVEYDANLPAGILLPHLANIKGLTTLLQLRAVAELEAGQTPQAFADLQLGFRLSDSIREEPILIDHLVRVATLGMDLQGVREGLARHAWSEAQLAELGQYLGGVDLLKELQHALRGERACAIGDFNYLRRQGFKFNPDEFPGDLPGILCLMPGGWFYQNMLTIARWDQEFLLDAVAPQQHRVFPDLSDRGDLAVAGMRTTPDNLLAKLLMPALGKASAKSARMQTYVDAARVACALERFRLANGQLPDALAALAPRFIARIPNDVIAGQPLRYRKTPDGGYLIYSIGWNQKDDGGKVEVTKSGAVDALTGDWVWQCPARMK